MTQKYPIFLAAGSFVGNRQIGFHSHPGVELILVTKGICRIDIGEATFQGANSTLFILPAKIPHNQINESNVCTNYISFKNIDNFNDHPRTIQSDAWINQWLSDICILSEKTNISLKNIADGLLSSIINRIRQLETIKQRQVQLHPALIRAIQYIEQNLERTFSLDDIAQAAGISRSFLSNIFSKQLQTSPVNYAISLKMNLAKRMLVNSYLSVKEISIKCGFQDPNFFCRSFKKHFHVSPGEYRSSNYDLEHDQKQTHIEINQHQTS